MTLERTNLPKNCLGALIIFFGDEIGAAIYADEDTSMIYAEIDSRYKDNLYGDVFYLPFNENTPNDINLVDRKSVEKYGYICDNIPDDIKINVAIKEVLL